MEKVDQNMLESWVLLGCGLFLGQLIQSAIFLMKCLKKGIQKIYKEINRVSLLNKILSKLT